MSFEGGAKDGKHYWTAREHSAIALCVPDSGTPWLDAMIRTALRDRFAGQALEGLLACDESKQLTKDQIGPTYAKGSYFYANFMLAERDREAGK